MTLRGLGLDSEVCPPTPGAVIAPCSQDWTPLGEVPASGLHSPEGGTTRLCPPDPPPPSSVCQPLSCQLSSLPPLHPHSHQLLGSGRERADGWASRCEGNIQGGVSGSWHEPAFICLLRCPCSCPSQHSSTWGWDRTSIWGDGTGVSPRPGEIPVSWDAVSSPCALEAQDSDSVV